MCFRVSSGAMSDPPTAPAKPINSPAQVPLASRTCTPVEYLHFYLSSTPPRLWLAPLSFPHPLPAPRSYSAFLASSGFFGVLAAFLAALASAAASFFSVAADSCLTATTLPVMPSTFTSSMPLFLGTLISYE